MRSSKLASVAALFGGAAWLVAVLYSDPALHVPLYYAGLGGLLLGLAGLGYALVATAPIWLRGVVSLANTMFGYMVWTLVQDTIGGTSGMLAGGVALVVAALVGFARSHPVHQHHPAAAGAHRAAR